MSVTFSGAFTFSGGGFTATLAPPTEGTAGWYGGGFLGTTVQRITFATDTATATVRGPLNGSFQNQGATGTFTYGWYAGGKVPGGGPSVSKVDRITYASDTDTASVRGTLDRVVSNLAAVTTDTYGWFGGGSSAVSKITYAIDTATAVGVGPLSVVQDTVSATGDGSTYGWFGGGTNPSSPAISTVSRITYSSDTNTASARGPLSLAKRSMGASGTSEYGWFGGGVVSNGTGISLVDRITYATDTATASVRGPLSASTFALAASGDNTYGWFSGGYVNGSFAVSTVNRITYATDTATAGVRGPLSAGTYYVSATSGIQ